MSPSTGVYSSRPLGFSALNLLRSGLAFGVTSGTSALAINDIKRGEVSTPREYLDAALFNGIGGASLAGVFGTFLPALVRALGFLWAKTPYGAAERALAVAEREPLALTEAQQDASFFRGQLEQGFGNRLTTHYGKIRGWTVPTRIFRKRTYGRLS